MATNMRELIEELCAEYYNENLFSELANLTARELDNYTHNQNTEFQALPYLLKHLEKFVINGDKLEELLQWSKYLPVNYPLFQSINNISEKRMTGHIAEYHLQVNLLYNELQCINTLKPTLTSDRLATLQEFLHLYSAYNIDEEQKRNYNLKYLQT